MNVVPGQHEASTPTAASADTADARFLYPALDRLAVKAAVVQPAEVARLCRAMRLGRTFDQKLLA